MGEVIALLIGVAIGVGGVSLFVNPSITEAKANNQDLKTELDICQKNLEKTNTLLQGGLMFK